MMPTQRLALVPDAVPGPIVSRWPVHAEDEIAAAVEVLRSGRVNSLVHGERCRAFEAAFAALCDMPHAIALANGTLALEVALRALGVGPGDEVVVTPRSFFASAACIVACGATPVFADVDPITQNITSATIAPVLTGRTRAVIAVHLAGWPCAMAEIVTLAKAHGLKVIEDCAQAHGATIDGRPVGSFGDAAAFSFCTDKIMSTGGEGGLLLLRDDDAFARAWSIKDHGKNLATVRMPATGRSFRWIHDRFGSNYRLTEMQAAIGLVQLAKLPAWLATRRLHARLIDRALAEASGLRLTIPGPDIGHSYYKYYAFVRPERLAAGWDRDRIVEAAAAAGIPCFSGSCPEIYRERAFAGDPRHAVRLRVARALGDTSLMLPLDPTMASESIVDMAERLRAIVAGATT